MWPSGRAASFIYGVANVALLASLAFGVVATLFIVWMGNVKETYLRGELASANETAATANKEAASARLEQERLKKELAWRETTPDQRRIIVAGLQGHALNVLVVHLQSDPEATRYADDIAEVLTLAGATVNRSSMLSPQAVVGLRISSRHDGDTDANLVASVFGQAGLPLAFVPPGPFLTIEVGNKPRPF